MNKIVSLASNKLIQNIYKCKKLPFTAYQFLQMDVTEIKETLISIVKTDQSNIYFIKKLLAIRRHYKIIYYLLIKVFQNLKIS